MGMGAGAWTQHGHSRNYRTLPRPGGYTRHDIGTGLAARGKRRGRGNPRLPRAEVGWNFPPPYRWSSGSPDRVADRDSSRRRRSGMDAAFCIVFHSYRVVQAGGGDPPQVSELGLGCLRWYGYAIAWRDALDRLAGVRTLVPWLRGLSVTAVARLVLCDVRHCGSFYTCRCGNQASGITLGHKLDQGWSKSGQA